MGQPVVHFEIGVADSSRSKTFYSELFEWKIEVDDNGYGLVDTGTGAGINGGILRRPQGVPPYVTVYVGVDDLETYLKRAEALGGRTVMPRMPVGDMGVFALLADPDGNVIGLFQESRTVLASGG
jgi:predicted enzyme related to lactoylglutathione lyase